MVILVIVIFIGASEPERKEYKFTNKKECISMVETIRKLTKYPFQYACQQTT